MERLHAAGNPIWLGMDSICKPTPIPLILVQVVYRGGVVPIQSQLLSNAKPSQVVAMIRSFSFTVVVVVLFCFFFFSMGYTDCKYLFLFFLYQKQSSFRCTWGAIVVPLNLPCNGTINFNYYTPVCFAGAGMDLLGIPGD